MLHQLRTILLGLFASSLAATAAAAAPGAAGFETNTIPAGNGPSIDIAIWYPTSSAPSDQKLGSVTQKVAPVGTIVSGRHPLVVISHGGGGWYGGHYDTALRLSRAGFIVAALTHPGDNFRDQSGGADMAARPRDLERLVDYMLKDWRGRSHVDAARIGAFGFSNGGFTVLVAIGGIPDFSRFGPHCQAHADFDDCRILAKSGISPAELPARFPASAWTHDRRIKAAVIAAPALGFLFTPQGLRDVEAPVQLWRAGDDHVLPQPEYAEAVKRALPRAPAYHLVANARHYDFLAPCDPALAADLPSICESNPGFNRSAFHENFNEAVLAFFSRALPEETPR